MTARKTAAIVSLALAACVTPNPEYCDSDRPCLDPAKPFCDELGEFPASNGLNNTCIPDPHTSDGGMSDGRTSDGETSDGRVTDSSENECESDAGSCPVCGNREIEVGEQCDGWNLGGKICADIGYAGGRLACTACTYDETGCYKCGDDNVDDGEECDRANLDGQSCTGLGFECGALACQDNCRFDTSGCRKDWAREVPAPVYALDIDPSETIHIAGEFEAPVVLGTTTLVDSNLYVARMSRDGVFQSAIAPTGVIDAMGNQIINDIAVGSDGSAYLVGPMGWGTVSFGTSTLAYAGSCGNEFWLAATNPTGTAFAWATSVGGAESGCDYGVGLSVDGHDNLFISGENEGPSVFGDKTVAGTGGFVAKLDPSAYTPATGGFVWTSTGTGSGDPGSDVAISAVSSDSAGNSVVVGSYWRDIELTPAGSVMRYLDGPSLFVAKLSHTGSFLWATPLGGEYVTGRDPSDRCALTTDQSGNSYVSCRFRNSTHFGDFSLTSSTTETFVAKLNINGTYLWAESLGPVVVNDIVISEGALYVAGNFSGTVTLGATPMAARGQTDVFIAKMSANTGQVLSALTGGGTQIDQGRGIAVSASGDVVVVGTQQADSTFGSTELTSGKGFVWSVACSLP